MSSGVALFCLAEIFYHQGMIQEAFSTYQKSVKKILKDEDPTAKIPATVMPAVVLDEFPRETLGAVWRNFVGCFRDPTMSFTEQSDPKAYKLLNSFRPFSSKSYPQLERTHRGRILLKGMQITAGLTLSLMAWDNRDRATAAKRYKGAKDLAATHSPFTVLSQDTVGLERWVYLDVQCINANLDHLVHNDIVHMQMLGGRTDSSAPERKDVCALPLPLLRIGKSGEATVEGSVMFATDSCAKCGKRGVKLMRCGLCKKMPCKKR
jgi:hypothetical protein